MYEEMRAVFERSFNDSRWRIAGILRSYGAMAQRRCVFKASCCFLFMNYGGMSGECFLNGFMRFFIFMNEEFE